MVTRKGHDGWCGICASEMGRRTQSPRSPSHLNQKPIQSDPQRSTQDSFLHPVVGFTFSPGQSRRRVSAGENLHFPTIGLFHKAAVSAPGEVPS